MNGSIVFATLLSMAFQVSFFVSASFVSARRLVARGQAHALQASPSAVFRFLLDYLCGRGLPAHNLSAKLADQSRGLSSKRSPLASRLATKFIEWKRFAMNAF